MRVIEKKTKKQIIMTIATNIALLFAIIAVSLVSFIPKEQTVSAE